MQITQLRQRVTEALAGPSGCLPGQNLGLLSTLTPNGSGGEFVQYHHPDRLGTRLVTNAQDTNSFEQVTLPFGAALSAESTGATNRRFTTYDRSVNTAY